jgi:hypothetical protein
MWRRVVRNKLTDVSEWNSLQFYDQRVTKQAIFPAFYLRGIHFNPEDESSTLLRNIWKLLPDYTASDNGTHRCDKFKSNSKQSCINERCN